MARHDSVFLANVLDSLSGLVYVYDLVDDQLVFLSRRWREEFDLECATVEFSYADRFPISNMIHPGDLPAVEAHLAALRSAAGDEAREVEYRVRRKDHSVVWVGALDRPLTREDDGRVRLIVGQARNLTAQKQAESGRDEVEARFRAVLENLPDAVFVVGADERVLLVNDAACAQLGYTKGELCRLRLRDFVAPEFRRRIPERLSGRVGTATARESVHVRADGRRVPVETVVVAVDLEGHPAFIGVARDISERRRLESRLQDAERLEALGRLAGGVAHDFNNILAAIQGAASLLARAELDDGQRRDLADEVENAACRGAELTRQLLTVGRRQPADLRPVDLAELVATTLVVVKRLLGPAIEIETDLGEGCWLMADRGMLTQVVMNLALNARDAMPSGGRLTLRVAPSSASPDELELFVQDTGTGIDASVLPRVFEPYFTTKPEGEGSGVGLATVHGIVAQHRGRISVESEAGAGTRFCVTLPRHHAPRREEATGGRSGTVAARPLDVLVVDDMETVRTVLTQLLEASGHRVLEAGSSPEALKLWDESGPMDLLVADVCLGAGGDGPSLARELRARDPELPVIFISGLIPDARELERVPGCDFLQKPFTLGVLNALLARRFPVSPGSAGASRTPPPGASSDRDRGRSRAR